MSDTAILTSPEAKAAISTLASAFGIAPEKAATAVDDMAAALNQRMLRATLSRGGVADIVGLIADQEAGRALGETGTLRTSETADAGNHVLDVLIGNKHVSRGIAARAARDSGIDVETAKKMLPVIASMMVGGLQKKAEPRLASLVRDVPALQAVNQSPLPIPGDNIPGIGDSAPAPRAPNNPFENLPDIIRRGGTRVPNGGSLDEIIRSILGNLLGNKNRGVVGTIIQAFILRWLANLARRFFSRIVLGR